jgi:hypothetical protein
MLQLLSIHPAKLGDPSAQENILRSIIAELFGRLPVSGSFLSSTGTAARVA